MNAKQPPLQSFVSFRNSQGELSRGTLLKLENATVVFEVYNPYSIVQLSEVLQELSIRRADVLAYKGRAVVTNLVNTGLMLIVSANLLDAWTTIPDLREDVSEIRKDAERFVVDAAASVKIRYGYRVAVGELRSFLSDLNRWLEEVEVACSERLRVRLNSYDGLLQFAAPILSRLTDLNRHFEAEAQKVGESDIGVHKMLVQQELHPLIMTAPYPYRTLSKPLGYAGDYEMMNMIHRNVPEGQNLYAKIVNAAYTTLPIATCVKNRVRLLQDYLLELASASNKVGGVFQAISIGCGPAVEVQRFTRESSLSNNAEFDLLDFNDETLDHARQKVAEAISESGNTPQVRFIHESVHSLLKSATLGHNDRIKAKYDFVYCAGLFDYLSDKVCSRLVRLFYSWLKEDGVLLVTNMHERTMNRFLLEHQAEWYLVYRNEDQMEEMIPGVVNKRTFTDDTGVNLCLEVRKIAKRTERLA